MAAGVVRWTARATSVASITLLAMILVGEPGTPTFSQAVAMAFFPFGVVAGMLIGWRREALGGIVTLMSLAGLYLWMTVLSGLPPRGPWFLAFSAPGLLFLICSLIEGGRGGESRPGRESLRPA